MLCTQSFYQECYFKSLDFISSECVYLVISFCCGVFIDLSGQTLNDYLSYYVFPKPKHGSCGHIMASFDSHCFCARCREKGKGSDPCISHLDCNVCNSLTEEQRIQLSTPSYRLKKEKRDSKKVSDTPKQDSSSSLIDPSVVMVVGAVDDQGIVKSPGSSSDKKKKQNVDKPKTQTSKDSKADKPSKSLKPTKSSQDSRFDQLDQKWSERFNRLEALLLAKSLEQPGPAFTTVKVTPTHSPPKTVVSSKPFIRPQPTPTTPRSYLQICLVVFRLLSSRPANRPQEKCPPTNLQIWLVLIHRYLTKYPAGRHQHLQGGRVHLPWTRIPTQISLTVPQ